MYKLNESKMFADITSNVAIIINSETGIYYGMNNCGSIVFKALIDSCSPKDIVDSLKKFKNCPTDIEQKLKVFIDELLQKEIIIESEKVSKDFSLDENVIQQDNFELKIAEYADAQDLLLADPIHDVDEEEGWQPVFKEDTKNDK